MNQRNVPLKEIMQKAYEKRILVPAFNVAYLPMTESIIKALKETRTFGLAEVAMPDIKKFGARSFKDVYNEFHKFCDSEYVRLHIDHVPVIDEEGALVDWEKIIKEGLRLGFDSVMVDGSRLSFEENINITRKVVEMAHTKAIPVEAELGAVLGHEKGPLPPYEELFSSGKGFTDPKEAERFVKETGVDWLSVAVGNIHGAISGAAKDSKKVAARININHLQKLRDVTGIPLVLHGGSGIQREYVLESIKNGITKINIGTDIRQAYEKALKEKPDDIGYVQESVYKKVKELVLEYFEIGNSVDVI